MSKAPVAIGLIGCGWISEIAHMPGLASIPAADVVAVADPLDERRAVAMRFFPGASTYRDAGSLIDDAKVSAVVLAVPPIMNASLATAAFEAGKDVYIEKPLALTKAEGASIVDAWLRSARIGMIGYNFRRNPAVHAATKLIAAGAVGQITSVQGRFTWNARAVGGWRSDGQAGGGAISDLASHHIDLVSLLCASPVARVSASIQQNITPGDTVSLTMITATNVVAQIHACSASGRNTNVLQIMGTEGHLLVDMQDPVLPVILQGEPPASRVRRAAMAVRNLRLQRFLASGNEPSFRSALEVYVGGCQDRHQIEPDLSAGLAVLHVVEAARTSANRGGDFVIVGDPEKEDVN